MSTLDVFHDHQLVGSYPADSQHSRDDQDNVTITEPDGTVHTYPAGSWHAYGIGFVCAGVDEAPDCPRCHPRPAEE